MQVKSLKKPLYTNYLMIQNIHIRKGLSSLFQIFAKKKNDSTLFLVMYLYQERLNKDAVLQHVVTSGLSGVYKQIPNYMRLPIHKVLDASYMKKKEWTPVTKPLLKVDKLKKH